MALTTYSELQSAIADWTNRTDLTAVIPDFIELTELELARDLRVSWLEKRATTVPTSAFVELPSDYNGMRNIQWNDSYRYALEQLTPHEMDLRKPDNNTGKPVFYAIHDEHIELRPAPASDNTATVQITYYHKPAVLSDSNTSNLFLTRATDALLYGSIIHASRYTRSPNDQWAMLYQNAKDRLLAQEDALSFPGEIAMRYDG